MRFKKTAKAVQSVQRVLMIAVYSLFFSIIFSISAPLAFAAFNIDLGQYSISNPEIDVTYSDLVSISSAHLIGRDIDNPVQPEYPLCMVPIDALGGYAKEL